MILVNPENVKYPDEKSEIFLNNLFSIVRTRSRPVCSGCFIAGMPAGGSVLWNPENMCS
jgi:hypothetical protein